MKWFIIIILILFLICLLIIFTKLHVKIFIRHAQDNDHIKVKFKAWFGLIKYTIDVPLVKVDDDSPSIVIQEQTSTGRKSEAGSQKTKQFTALEIIRSLEDTKTVLQHVVGLHAIIRKFLLRVTITKFEWHSILGIGDAASTGILTGLGWSIKGGILGIVGSHMILKTNPDITITPSFQQPFSQTNFVCMIHFRIGNAMLAGIRLVRFWRGGTPKFKSFPLSILSGTHSKKSV
ncbi:DUF2953 domain-containing protein [Bacillus timonensis]|nr:DUF2953 domain-containing protein [Bacillus timonensis]